MSKRCSKNEDSRRRCGAWAGQRRIDVLTSIQIPDVRPEIFNSTLAR